MSGNPAKPPGSTGAGSLAENLIAAGPDTLWKSDDSFPPHMVADGCIATVSTSSATVSTGNMKYEDEDEEEECRTSTQDGAFDALDVIRGLLLFDQAPPPPPTRPMPATPVQQLPEVMITHNDAPKPKRQRTNKPKRRESAATPPADAAAGNSFREAFAQPDVLPEDHRPARGRRRPKQLAMMSKEQKAAENEQRMEKNRQLAREGRLRKKASVDSLRQRVLEAGIQNKKQARTIAKAKNEIQKLKQQLELLQQQQRHHPHHPQVAAAVDCQKKVSF